MSETPTAGRFAALKAEMERVGVTNPKKTVGALAHRKHQYDNVKPDRGGTRNA